MQSANCEEEYIKSFKVTTELRQGDTQSPRLFSLILEHVVRIMNETKNTGLNRAIY